MSSVGKTNAIFWPTVGKMGVDEQGISLFNPPPHPLYISSLFPLLLSFSCEPSVAPIASQYIRMLRNNYKLDQFVSGPFVYKLVIQFLNWLACFQLYKVKLSRLETRPNGLKDGQRHENCTSWLNKQPVSLTA